MTRCWGRWLTELAGVSSNTRVRLRDKGVINGRRLLASCFERRNPRAWDCLVGLPALEDFFVNRSSMLEGQGPW